eukprot:12846721-Alexandrium_andersonii.AAC.1
MRQGLGFLSRVAWEAWWVAAPAEDFLEAKAFVAIFHRIGFLVDPSEGVPLDALVCLLVALAIALLRGLQGVLAHRANL